MDDRELLDQCIRRVDGAWSEFLLRFRAVLRKSVAATLKQALSSVPEDDVEAAVEQALLALVKDDFATLRTFAGKSSLAGYLRAIATKVTLNHLRTEGRRGWLRFRPLESTADVAAPVVAEDDGRMGRLLKALEQLPPKDRLILNLFHLDGASYKDIARILGIPMNTVSPNLIRAREKLRALFEDDR